MGTKIRPELSQKNKYWINKHRHYELKHFCLQYPAWKKKYSEITHSSISTTSFGNRSASNSAQDPTAKIALENVYLEERMKLVEDVAYQVDKELHKYLIKAITEELSYLQLKTKYGIPCCRATYYDRYRRFFWLLDKERA